MTTLTRRVLSISGWMSLALWTVLGLDRPIGDGDECYHAEILRQMLRSGDFLRARWFGAITYERPPLTYWFAAPFASLIPGEVGVRLSSAIASYLTLGVVFHAALALWRSRVGAVLAVVLLAGAPSFHVFTRTLLSEPPFVLALTTALAATLWAEHDARFLVLAGAQLGAAIAIKSFAALPALVTLLPWLIQAQRRYGDRRTLLMAAAWFSGLALFPFALGFWVGGGEFLQHHILFHLLARVHGGFVGLGGGVFAYASSIKLRDGLVVAVWLVIGSVGALGLGLRERERSLQVAGSFALAVFVLMSCIGTRLPHYVLPVYPAAALGVAGVYAACARKYPRLGAGFWQVALPLTAAGIGLASQRFGGGSDYLFERPYGKLLGVAAQRAALTPGERMYAYEWYGFSLGYYADHPIVLLTSKPERYAQVMFEGGSIKRAGVAALVPPLPGPAGSQIVIAGHVADLSRAKWLEPGQVLAAAPPYFLMRATLRPLEPLR